MQDELKPQMRLATPDHEAQMARADLYRAAKHSMKLFQMIQEGQELEGWVQAKITKAADYLDSIYHYMEYQMKFGGGAPAVKVDDITGEAEVKTEVKDEEEDEEMQESLTYEQRLQSLLEAKVKKIAKPKETKGKKVKEAADDKEKRKKDKEEMKKKIAKVIDTNEGSTGDYSAKKARAGKDIGKPGKAFAKIAKSAAKRYGSKERGEKVAGAVLAKLRAKG